jgi:hypothetical protein
MMKPYEPWEYCKAIHCLAIEIQGEEYRGNTGCVKCNAYKLHQYLRHHSQILEAGSELERLVTVAELAYRSDQIVVSQGGYVGELARLIMLRLEG